MKDKKTNVLYLAYDGMTDPLGQSQVLSYVRLLSQKGYSFDIISFEKPHLFEKKRAQVEQMIAGYDITWHPLPYTKSPPVLSTLKDLWVGWQLIKKLARQKDISIVHSRGYVVAILALRLKKWLGTKMIFDMRGWWPDEKKDSGAWQSAMYQPIYNYFKRLEKQFFGESDYAISLTQVGKDEIVKLHYKEAEKVGVIPTCVDFNIFKPYDEATRVAMRQQMNIPLTSKVLVYSGSFGGNYDTGVLCRFFLALKKANDDSYLLILSKDDKDYIAKSLLQGGIDMLGSLSNSIVIAQADYKDVHKYLMAGNYGVVNYTLTYSTIGRSPTKLGEYWACGLPVISMANIGDIDILLAKYPVGGVLVTADTEQGYLNAIEKLLATEVDKAALRISALDYYDLVKGADAYANIYKGLLTHQ